MKQLILKNIWIVAPCATVLLTALLGVVLILGLTLGTLFLAVNLIKFLIPINRIAKKKEKIHKETKFDLDLKKYKNKFAIYEN